MLLHDIWFTCFTHYLAHLCMIFFVFSPSVNLPRVLGLPADRTFRRTRKTQTRRGGPPLVPCCFTAIVPVGPLTSPPGDRHHHHVETRARPNGTARSDERPSPPVDTR